MHGGFHGLGQPVEWILTPGPASDVGHAEALLGDHEPEVVIADRGDDKKALVERIESRGAEAVTALSIVAAESRPNHFCKRRTTG